MDDDGRLRYLRRLSLARPVTKILAIKSGIFVSSD
jgi:hypothetical protein